MYLQHLIAPSHQRAHKINQCSITNSDLSTIHITFSYTFPTLSFFIMIAFFIAEFVYMIVFGSNIIKLMFINVLKEFIFIFRTCLF
ncbi:hypothetical protein FKM82_017655 [Ascaphus truei]